MMRRWLIRALALSLLTLCAVAWVGSHFIGVGIDRFGVQRNFGVYAYFHVVKIEFRVLHAPDKERSIWVRQFAHLDPKYQTEADKFFRGFVYRSPNENSHFWILEIPLWFPTLLSALVLWLVWRKTRPKYNGRGFPVEVMKKSEG